jgi:hypothetical protein
MAGNIAAFRFVTDRLRDAQLAPFNLHDVLQVVVVPRRQPVQTLTHCSSSLASYFVYRCAMHMRCCSVYSGCSEQSERPALAKITPIKRHCIACSGRLPSRI